MAGFRTAGMVWIKAGGSGKEEAGGLPVGESVGSCSTERGQGRAWVVLVIKVVGGSRRSVLLDRGGKGD